MFGNQFDDKGVEMENTESSEKGALSSDSSKKIIFKLFRCMSLFLPTREK